MMYQEIETAVRCNLNMVVIVLVDRSVSLIKIQQESRGYANHGVDFHSIDFALSAEACGATGCTVDTVQELADTVAECLSSGGSHVIQLPIDHRGYHFVRNGRLPKNPTSSE
jgi:acetolactate synthase-1/2/3 large subunit